MSFYNWETCPSVVRTQVKKLMIDTKNLLTTNCVGIYLHGSLALGCFNPAHSDLDLLVVTYHPLSVSTKAQVAQQLLALSQQPSAIEISYLAQAMLVPWHYPPVFDFHYSEMWRSAYERDLTIGAWQDWNNQPRRDPDLGAHITVIRQRGITLCGAPIPAVFPVVPPADYLAAALDDVMTSLADPTGDPVYTILNACRTLAYLHTGQIYSKDEGGQWAQEHMPTTWHALIHKARVQYCDEARKAQFDPTALAKFREYMREALLWSIPE